MDASRCHDDVKKAILDRDVAAKQAARRINNLERVPEDLVKARGINELQFQTKMLALEQEARSSVKDKRQIELDKSALEEQQIRCQRETERLENRSEIVRLERVRLRRLMSEGQELLDKALEDQTQAIYWTTQVFWPSYIFLMLASFVRIANFVVCLGFAKASGKA